MTASLPVSVAIHLPRRTRKASVARLFFARPLAATAVAFVVVVCAGSVLFPLLGIGDPYAVDLTSVLQGPSAEHLLGTDQLGRDILLRLAYGGAIPLGYTVEVVAVGLLVGVPLGLASGYLGGGADRAIMRSVDIAIAIPAFIIVLVVLSVFSDSMWVAMMFLGLLSAPILCRNIRGSVIAVRHELFVDAARVAGLSDARIMATHVLPRIRGQVLVQLTIMTAGTLLMTVSLGYLGYGLSSPDQPSWGSLIAEAARVLTLSPWPLIGAGTLTCLMILSFGIIGDSLRDSYVERWQGGVVAPARRGASAPAPVDRAPVEPGHARTGDELLRVRGMTIEYRVDQTDVAAVSDVSFSMHRGEIVGLVGESGCGKTTVARSLVGLLRGTGRVTGGSIAFDGRELVGAAEQDWLALRGSRIAAISQEPLASLDPTRKVGVLLRGVVRRHESLSRGQADARVLELLAQVRLPEPERVARSYPHELSGGMAQRVAIARALVASPDLLVADEPTTALDVTVQSEILDLLRDLSRSRDLAILLITHDWGVVADICDRAIVMYAGEVVEAGDSDDVFYATAHPYSQALLSASPSRIVSAGARLASIPGAIPAPGSWPSSCRFAARCAFATAVCEEPVGITHLNAHHDVRCVAPLHPIGAER